MNSHLAFENSLVLADVLLPTGMMNTSFSVLCQRWDHLCSHLPLDILVPLLTLVSLKLQFSNGLNKIIYFVINHLFLIFVGIAFSFSVLLCFLFFAVFCILSRNGNLSNNLLIIGCYWKKILGIITTFKFSNKNWELNKVWL